MTKEEAKLVLDNARPQTKEIDRQFYDDEDLNNALDMAIKALEQQTSEDLINLVSEQEKWLDSAGYNAYNVDIAFKSIIRAIQNMPPVTPSQSWIPVSEELPKKTGWYFVTFKTTDGVAVCEASYRKPENYWTGKDIRKKLFDNNEVIAWQPLPKPYEEKRGNENDI